jgi:ABC-type transport system involved in multi-copper enzyme maturation permease subunit
VFSTRALPLYLLAAIPATITFIVVAVSTIVGEPPPEFSGPSGATMLFAALFQLGILRTTLYFAAVWIFMNLFRGEVLDRSLHYYFLSPVRRDVLVAGKFASAWVGVSTVFSVVTVVCFGEIHAYFGNTSLTGLSGQLFAYLSIVWMACLGYGAIFMVAGLFMRNPVIPAILVFFWEQANPFLPGLLKKFSVIFYLQSLFPIDISEGPIEIISEPVPLWIGIPGFIIFSGLTLLLAGFQIRRMEVHYAED